MGRIITEFNGEKFKKIKLVKKEDTYKNSQGDIIIKEEALLYECIGIYTNGYTKRYAIEPIDKSKTKNNSILAKQSYIAKHFYKA